MRLEAALEGNLSEMMKAEQLAITTASRRTITNASLEVRNELRAQTEASGLGKLSKTWKNRNYIEDLAAVIYPDSPRPIQAFINGGVFTSPDGKWLAIPTDAAPKKGTGGKKISPSTFPEAALGKLRFVYISGKVSLLVVDNLKARNGKRPGFGKASATALKTGRGLATVIMFILVPRINIRKRIDINAVRARWLNRLPQYLANEINNAAEAGK
jgi:hypothetical protein